MHVTLMVAPHVSTICRITYCSTRSVQGLARVGPDKVGTRFLTSDLQRASVVAVLRSAGCRRAFGIAGFVEVEFLRNTWYRMTSHCPAIVRCGTIPAQEGE